eukprot:GHVT01044104.1.p2 GENE.GHVT01044104.1~~GHVT01044104.1.p2  ORF type:complete len:277 (+),score=17.05 GHVT01044104.1:1606-2436(+)
MVPTRSKSSSDLVKGLHRMLAHAQHVAAQDQQAEEREFRLQERVRQAEADRAISQELMEKAQRELRELQKQVAENRPDPEVVGARRKAVVGLVERTMVGRAAEALRRRETGKLLIGVAASEQVFRSTTFRNRETCQCHSTAQAALKAGTALPETASNKTLEATVKKVLKSMSVRQPVNLDSYLLDSYDFHDEEDCVLVEQAIRNGVQNTATYRILENSLCLDPHQTAESQVQDSCPSLVIDSSQLSLQGVLDIVATPPIAAEEVVEGNNDTTEATP